MADEKNEDDPGEQKGGRGGILPIALTALVAAVLGGGVSAVVSGKLGVAREGGTEAPVESQQPTAADNAASFQERLFSLDPIVVNVSGKGYARFLKVKIELECESPAVRDEVEARLPQVRDAVLTLVSSRPLADISDFEGKTLLKQSLRERIDQILTGGSIRSVLFTEFVVQ